MTDVKPIELPTPPFKFVKGVYDQEDGLLLAPIPDLPVASGSNTTSGRVAVLCSTVVQQQPRNQRLLLVILGVAILQSMIIILGLRLVHLLHLQAVHRVLVQI